MKKFALALLMATLAVPAAAKDFNGQYRLQTQFQGPNKCLEGNKFDPNSTLRGAAFMDTCQNVSGQIWMIEPVGNGWHKLRTQFQGPNKCLEGNKLDARSTLGGGAFMDNCQNVSGQLWKFEPAGSGWFRMKTQFQGDGKCFEGNKFDPSSTLGGAAFMDNCQNVSGQMWKLVPAN